MRFFQPLKRVSAKSLSSVRNPNLDAKTTMGGMFDSVCEDSLRLQTGSWWGSNQEGGATIIDLEAMETAALWNGVEKPNNRFPPPLHRAWKTLRVSHCHAAGKHAISKKLKPMQFLFSCNT